MTGQTPPGFQQKDAKNSIDLDLAANIRPKCLFSMTDNIVSPKKQDYEAYEIYQDPMGANDELLKGISSQRRKLTDEEMESSLFPSGPKCLMDTPEFSQEKKSKIGRP